MKVCRAWTTDHQHSLPATNSQDIMDVPLLQTLASHWLCHSTKEGRTDRMSEWQRLSGADCWTDHRLSISKLSLCIQPARRPQGKKCQRLDEAKLKQDNKKQEANTHQWHLQPFRCIKTPFSGSRWELDNLQRHRLISNGFPRISISQTLYVLKKTCLMRMTKKSRDSLKRNTRNTRHASVISAQYLVRLPIQTYVRESRQGSETCRTPGWAKMLIRCCPFQTEKIWINVKKLVLGNKDHTTD